jgi:DNA-binding LytR/AlgR family response regulator
VAASLIILNIKSMKTYQQKGLISQLVINHKTSQKVFIKNVVLLKGDSNYTTFHFKFGKEKLVARTIKFFESHLEAQGFLRVHRRYLINPLYIQKYDEQNEVLMMANGLEATISRRRKGALKNW